MNTENFKSQFKIIRNKNRMDCSQSDFMRKCLTVLFEKLHSCRFVLNTMFNRVPQQPE